LSVAFDGVTVAESCNEPPGVEIAFPPDIDIPVTGITWLLIVIVISPNIPEPSLAVARAVTVPLETAVTTPLELIVAWPVSLIMLQVTVLFVALAGVIVAVKVKLPLSCVMVDAPPAPVTVIPETGTI